MPLTPDQRIAEFVQREASRLRSFIRRRVPNAQDVEDIVQDVFAELVEANRRLMPIDHVTGWVYRVARNRIIDLFRRRRAEQFSDAAIVNEDGDLLTMEDLLPSGEAWPDAAYARQRLIDELHRALRELPEELRYVFVAHEIEGLGFRQMAAATGANLNTLLSRKRYAVRHLRERLQRTYDDLKDRQGA